MGVAACRAQSVGVCPPVWYCERKTRDEDTFAGILDSEVQGAMKVESKKLAWELNRPVAQRGYVREYDAMRTSFAGKIFESVFWIIRGKVQ